MKKLILSIGIAFSAIAANAQSFNVGTSSSTTDYMGNTTTTHRNQYGQTTGTSTSSTDYMGNTTTTHRNQYGLTTGTSSSSTDYMRNKTTIQHSDNPNSTIWSW